MVSISGIGINWKWVFLQWEVGGTNRKLVICGWYWHGVIRRWRGERSDLRIKARQLFTNSDESTSASYPVRYPKQFLLHLYSIGWVPKYLSVYLFVSCTLYSRNICKWLITQMNWSPPCNVLSNTWHKSHETAQYRRNNKSQTLPAHTSTLTRENLGRGLPVCGPLRKRERAGREEV